MKPSDNLSPHFALSEFLRGGSMEGVSSDIIVNLRMLSKKLEQIRELLGGHPITITSGFRTAAHNSSIKTAAKGSMHLYGLAADFVVSGLEPPQVQAKLMAVKDKLGICVEITHGNWTHIDLRPSCIVFENLGNREYKTLSLAEIKEFIRKHGAVA